MIGVRMEDNQKLDFGYPAAQDDARRALPYPILVVIMPFFGGVFQP